MKAAVVLYDGVCNLCDGLGRFIVARDPAASFRFVPLQSEAALRLLQTAGLPQDQLDTIVVLSGDRVFTRADAVLRLLAGLRQPWSWLTVLRYLPVSWRDAAYRLLARNRYRLFGMRDSCDLPRRERVRDLQGEV